MKDFLANYIMGDGTTRSLPLSAENLADARKQALSPSCVPTDPNARHASDREPPQQIELFEGEVLRDTIYF